ncbi:hypothetical protein L596_012888 [Steinernema carpocapsae]|uniref:7TM GPCR serpentine receptor class x (Srx) domain-containing protein n=1 Tax=Steinernema carpocapsae TaxID=34508 RepID=A0A4U5NYR4_STECR|nr:hypothetical protein L596_012888 [Steinernema carpocapsae]
MYCSSSEVLALNRMLEFANKRLSIFLFDGKRVLFWVAVVVTYAIACTFLVPDAFYHYDPYAGTFLFIEANGQLNVVHLFNNFFKCGFLTLSYGIMLVFIFRLKNQTSHQGTLTTFHVKVSIQTLTIAVLGDAVTVGYLASYYLPLSNSIAQHTGTFGQLLWISVHSGSGLIYLFMNRAVNKKFKRMFCGAYQLRNGLGVTPNTGVHSLPRTTLKIDPTD